MKIVKYIILTLAAVMTASCVKPEAPVFGVQIPEGSNEIVVGPEGGVRTIKVNSNEKWVAKTTAPWVTVSPANGVGSADCKIIIDSTLTFEDARTTSIRIESVSGVEKSDFTINQEGFPYQLKVNKNTVNIASFMELSKRNFEVEVSTNFEYEIVIPAEAKNWLTATKTFLVLDRGARPRTSTVTFTWKPNFDPEDKNIEITFRPKDTEINPTILHSIALKQDAAQKIVEGTVEGDSLSIIAIHQALGCWMELDTSEKLENWNLVEVWKEGEHKGRVRKATFQLFNTKEGIPYHVKYLTAAEELKFYGNSNTFMLSLNPGEHLSALTQLKRLTIGAYGLVDLHPSMIALTNLEALCLEGNNFQDIPRILTRENFPKLRVLELNTNQRKSVFDLSQSSWDNIGGLVDACKFDEETGKRTFPIQLLEWDSLDSLRLSVNYLQGELPDMEHMPKWTAEEVNACDTLSSKLIGLPKVLPNTDFFAINLNRLTGKIPDWLLYHPKLDLWYPMSLVFDQYGSDENGKKAGFTNTPPNLNYYYELDGYENKKYKQSYVTE